MTDDRVENQVSPNGEQPSAESRLIPVQLSASTTAHLKALNGLEARKADALSEKPEFQNSTRAIASVRKLVCNGSESSFGMPANASDVNRVLNRLSADEYDMLTLKYIEHFTSPEVEAQAKKLQDRQ